MQLLSVQFECNQITGTSQMSTDSDEFIVTSSVSEQSVYYKRFIDSCMVSIPGEIVLQITDFAAESIETLGKLVDVSDTWGKWRIGAVIAVGQNTLQINFVGSTRFADIDLDWRKHPERLAPVFSRTIPNESLLLDTPRKLTYQDFGMIWEFERFAKPFGKCSKPMIDYVVEQFPENHAFSAVHVVLYWMERRIADLPRRFANLLIEAGKMFNDDDAQIQNFKI
jgi:hypothetical protein